ncbi:cation diffusion facilitator family transporter [Propionispira arboris]|uniref:Cation diffusion facilitator family transporter n=1 Tax=Propionispira arboris TaxID=84035 RepID=A0A1H7A764_9FIRM|nr:cation diffusion facilitator family transporter [Propionispira arboris]SEJ59737.1 cation diffusion facilitator family transporter [Propionispira arboris]
MTTALIKKFVPHYEQIHDSKVRASYGILAGSVGIIANILLFVFKLTAGLLSGAVSIVADAFNNLSDAGSSVVTLLGFKMAEKPPDFEHPFGHGRIEYLAGLFISIAIILVGVELFRTSLQKIFSPEEITVDFISGGILLASIVVKFWMAAFNKNLGKRIKSAAMEATSVDSLSDCVATTVVLIAMGVYYFTGINVDGFAGIGVALFVFYSGIMTAKDTLQPLLGQAPDADFVEAIEQIVNANPIVVGLHDLIVHDYGPGRRFVSLHVEVPASMDMMEAHELIDGIEYKLRRSCGCEVTIHMDPIIIDNPKLVLMRESVAQVIAKIDESIHMHDFRVTKSCNGFNLIFDVVVVFGFKYSDADLKKKIQADILVLNKTYNAVVKISHSYM